MAAFITIIFSSSPGYNYFFTYAGLLSHYYSRPKAAHSNAHSPQSQSLCTLLAFHFFDNCSCYADPIG